MGGLTGQGQTAKLGSTVIPNIRSINITNTGNVISETVADGVLQQALGAGWQFVVDFVIPDSSAHTLEGGLKAGEEGALEIVSAGTKYTSASGKSSGYTKSSPSNGFATAQVTLVIDDDPTMASPA